MKIYFDIFFLLTDENSCDSKNTHSRHCGYAIECVGIFL